MRNDSILSILLQHMYVYYCMYTTVCILLYVYYCMYTTVCYRKLGNRVMVTWYNRSITYLPSQVDGDFTLQLYTDMNICDVIDQLANQLACPRRNIRIYEARRYVNTV